jgi:hypothetical protein
MNRAYDYNGVVVAESRPKKILTRVKKTLHIDSADRDQVKYYTNGDFVVYLPRTYQQVVSIRLKDAQFPPLVSVSSAAGAVTHPYTSGPNTPLATYTLSATQDVKIGSSTYYFLIGLEGLNKTDETTVGANRSTYSDSFFAKIPATTTTYGASTFINYNDHGALENIATYSPPVENLDRLRITVRTHAQQDKSGFLYWTSDGAGAAAGNRGAEFNLTLEVEYLENTFDDFSTYETRLSDR